MAEPIKLIHELLDRQEYQTAYAFNSLVAPRFTRAINTRFTFVETDMTGGSKRDSHGQPYQTLRHVMYVPPKANLDGPLTKLFLDTIEHRLEGKRDFISWQAVPQVRVAETRVMDKDFKVLTLYTSFSAK